jgi:DDE superfamily endonuclease
MIKAHRRQLPHAYVVGDDEFGRVSRFRQKLRACKEHYVLDIPGGTSIRELRPGEWNDPPSHRPFKKKLPFVHAQDWVAQQPQSAWQRVEVRDAEKGPLIVEALSVMVQAKLGNKHVGDLERLLVIRSGEKTPRLTYCLSNAPAEVPLSELVEARKHRFWVEHLFEQAKGDAGLDQYEVRSWVGWHHHMTLSLLATWFLALECRRTAKKKDARDHRLADARNLPSAAEESAAIAIPDCKNSYPCAGA